ncbi:uncharacterized protein LOC144179411 [Haemaphysalis longicornis]
MRSTQEFINWRWLSPCQSSFNSSCVFWHYSFAVICGRSTVHHRTGLESLLHLTFCPPSADQHLLTAVTVPLPCLQHSSCHSSGNCHSSAGHLSQPNGFPTFPGFYLMHVLTGL